MRKLDFSVEKVVAPSPHKLLKTFFSYIFYDEI